MSQFSLRFALALAGCLLIAPPAQGRDWARTMFSELRHDFGNVALGSKVQHEFTFTNPHDRPLHISAVRSSCGCTQPVLPKDTIGPREKGSVIAVFNTQSFTGQKAATMTVVIAQPYYTEVQLQVSGYIRTDVVFDPAEVAFGEVAQGAAREIDVRIAHAGRPDWQIVDVRSQCPHLAVRLSEPESSAAKGARYQMRVTLKDSMPVGEIRERLTLVTNDRNLKTVTLSVSGRVTPPLVVSPAAVNLGAVAGRGVIERRLVVRADNPFKILDVRSDDPRFSFEVPESEAKLHFVKLHFQPQAAAPGPVRQRIEIVSDLPGGITADCLITGHVTGP